MITRWTDRLVGWPQDHSAWTKRVHRKPRALARAVGVLVTWVWRRPVVHRSAAALHADAAQLRQFSQRAGSAIQALIRENRAAHCILTPDTLCCRYHVMVAALDHAQKAAVRRSPPKD